jgi:Domain of unknown function (DUF6443)
MKHKKNTSKIVLLILWLLAANTSGAQPAPYTSASANFVRIWDATAPQTSPAALVTGSLRDVKQTTAYFDGLGRPLQTVAKQGSMITGSSAVDMVGITEYDAFGREQYKYLLTPASNTGANASITDGNFKLNPFAQQAAFYNSASTTSPLSGQGETFFYSQTNFEASPLNRVQETAAPGNSWAGTMGQALETNRRSAKMKYYINTAADGVRIWTVTIGAIGSFSTYVSSSAYTAGLLFKNISIDENNKQVVEFKDKEGKIILKKVQLTASSDAGTGSGHIGWLCTYYVYDDFNQLRCVIQPRGVELIENLSWALTDATILAEQCFRYEYDQRQRMVVKKVPGAGEVYMVYDAKDRFVMTQDANLRTVNKWMVTLYDYLNRPVQTGLLLNTYNTPTAAKTFAQHLTDAYISSAYPFVSTSTPAVTYWEYLSKIGYDDYTAVPAASGLNNTIDATYNTSSYGYNSTNASPDYAQPIPTTASAQTKGVVTWTEIKILGTTSYEYAVMLYDDKARTVQVKSKNITGGADITTTQYDWSGKPLVMIQKQVKATAPAQTTVVVSKMIYDDLGRLLQADKKIQNTNVNANAVPASFTTVSKMEYDALGQLKKKNLGNKPGAAAGTPLAKLDYEYNIRGWLLSVNKSYITAASNADQYFGMQLGYDRDGALGTFPNKQYNGNIGGTIWKSEGDQLKRKYDFSYDAVNRLLKADFNQYKGTVFDKSDNVDFSMQMGDGINATSAYDANGNIKSMTEKGLKINVSSNVDQLTYTYPTNSNKLAKVADAIVASDNGKLGDFKDGTNGTTDDYTYDANGNMNIDNNKAISSIAYNYLNLPSVITITGKGSITYTYNAAGNKIKN